MAVYWAAITCWVCNRQSLENSEAYEAHEVELFYRLSPLRPLDLGRLTVVLTRPHSSRVSVTIPDLASSRLGSHVGRNIFVASNKVFGQVWRHTPADPTPEGLEEGSLKPTANLIYNKSLPQHKM